jgi:hypothetical protein
MKPSMIRSLLLALGLLVGAFGLISAFTPRGLSWGLEFIAVLLVLPWLANEGRDRWKGRSSTQPTIPDWHPESTRKPL